MSTKLQSLISQLSTITTALQALDASLQETVLAAGSNGQPTAEHIHSERVNKKIRQAARHLHQQRKPQSKVKRQAALQRFAEFLETQKGQSIKSTDLKKQTKLSHSIFYDRVGKAIKDGVISVVDIPTHNNRVLHIN